MENTQINEAVYHMFVAGVVGAGAWFLIAFLVTTNRILMLVHCMRLLENVLLGLWGGFIAANVAILASALPYIYTQQDPSMKCGSLGITNLAINMIPGSMLAIVLLAVFFGGGRACISATIRERSPLVGSILKGGAFIGGILWLAGVLSGFTLFAWFFEQFMVVVPNPPRLPSNLNDLKACSEFIGIASKPSIFDPLGSGLEYFVDNRDQRRPFTGTFGTFLP